MFRIYKRMGITSVPSWAWFFKQLTDLGRRLSRVDDEALKEASLERTHFAEGYWLTPDGAREPSFYGPTVMLGSRIVNHEHHGGHGSHIGKGEFVSVPIVTKRVSVDAKSTGKFRIAYSAYVNFSGIISATGAPGSDRYCAYSFAMVDGHRVNTCTDYVAQEEAFRWGSLEGDLGGTSNQRLNGVGYVELIEGVHTLEIVVSTTRRAGLHSIEHAITELH